MESEIKIIWWKWELNQQSKYLYGALSPKTPKFEKVPNIYKEMKTNKVYENNPLYGDSDSEEGWPA